MNYATFWQRFAASLVDTFVLLPLIFTQLWLESLSRAAAFFLVIPMTAAYCTYTIYCHGRFGKTVGKHALGIRVVKTTSEPIGWREAWLRSSVDLAFAVVAVISSFAALVAITDAEYYGVDWLQRAGNLQSHHPQWLAWTYTANQIWIWSEVLVVLFNEKRRALHDYIAGTVVIVDRTMPATETQSA
jgi:uncharacterized RDD family membrane protein YckC